ncbi:hypothetical protein FRC12_002198 [Ceratobasidium sp. 428]|nr:hypothetical protein FRC12_002198 [Ceratobasidium sp. 428]
MVHWLLQGFKAINRPDIIKKAFALCVVPNSNFNLSYESLNGRDARKALHDLLTTNPELYAKIASNKVTDSHNRPEYEDELPFNDSGEEDASPTVEEVSDQILNAQVAQDSARNGYNTLTPLHNPPI